MVFLQVNIFFKNKVNDIKKENLKKNLIKKKNLFKQKYWFVMKWKKVYVE